MKIRALFACLLLFIISSCEKDEPDGLIIRKDVFNGYAQKGPFLNGSSIIISELDASLNQTGRSYTTTISDNSGSFEQKNIELASKYVALRADGFYFNEITGENSSAQLTLNAIADVSDGNSANVNILTHLEKSRIEYLVTQKQFSFKSAKAQAQQEILKIFGFDKANIVNSEILNLARVGDDNAILLAISAIIQGYRTTADMSELLANIITDIKEDGELNNSSTGSKLINDARLLDLPSIRVNLENKYKELGISTIIPHFEKYVQLFVETTKFTPTKFILYPNTSSYGANILSDQINTVTLPKEKESGVEYSMAADLPAGTNLKIILKGGPWGYRSMPNGPVNWEISQYSNSTQTFTAKENGRLSDLNIQFSNPGTVSIEYYENNSVTPTKIKSLIIE